MSQKPLPESYPERYGILFAFWILHQTLVSKAQDWAKQVTNLWLGQVKAASD